MVTSGSGDRRQEQRESREQVVSTVQAGAALLWGSRKVEVPSPPSGACGARFSVKWRRNTLLGQGYAEGGGAARAMLGAPSSSHHSFAISHTSCRKTGRYREGNPTVRFGEDFKWVLLKIRLKGGRRGGTSLGLKVLSLTSRDAHRSGTPAPLCLCHVSDLAVQVTPTST